MNYYLERVARKFIAQCTNKFRWFKNDKPLILSTLQKDEIYINQVFTTSKKEN